MNNSPPYGIPIPHEIHEQYSDELKAAWETFNTWWQEALADSDGTVSRGSMPEDVTLAMKLILTTPIPTYDNATGADSCYMVGVQGLLTD
jgi:hypothetical protein